MPRKVSVWWKMGIWWKAGVKHTRRSTAYSHKYYFISGIFILCPFTFYVRFLKTIKWCRLFSQWELQIGLRQLCLIYIFQSEKKSRLISLTDSGCLGCFLFIKVKLPSDGLALKIQLLKEANSCLKLAESWSGGFACSKSFPQLSTLEHFPFVSNYSCHDSFCELQQLCPRRCSTSLAVIAHLMGRCSAWKRIRGTWRRALDKGL